MNVEVKSDLLVKAMLVKAMLWLLSLRVHPLSFDTRSSLFNILRFDSSRSVIILKRLLFFLFVLFVPFVVSGKRPRRTTLGTLNPRFFAAPATRLAPRIVFRLQSHVLSPANGFV